MCQAASALRIGFVPEHFSTPLHFAEKHFGLQANVIPFPSGSGHMITALRNKEIDVAIGLTEAWVAGLGKEDVEGDGGYRIVGTYVETPLCKFLPSPVVHMPNTWAPEALGEVPRRQRDTAKLIRQRIHPSGWAISTGAQRPEISSVASLKDSAVGVSRIGSGSYVMSYVLADQQGWLTSPEKSPYKGFKVLQTFDKLRAAVNDGTADFFMWEHFTSKRYYDSGEIRRLGDIYTPWPSWQIVASTATTQLAKDPRLQDLFQKLDRGIQYLETHHDETIEYISTHLDYSKEDAAEWLKTVRFASPTAGVDLSVAKKCIAVLVKAGVLKDGKGFQAEQMVVAGLGEQIP